MLLPDKTVVLFGGTSGIGLATAVRAQAEGAHVVVAGSSEVKVAAARDALDSGADAVVLDVRDEAQVAELCARYEHIDHVVSTIGVLAHTGAPDGMGLDAPLETILRPMDVRFTGSVLIAKYCLPRMSAGGSISFTTGGGMFRPLRGEAMAIASEGAVDMLTRCLAVEAAPVRVNSLSPGAIDTAMARSVLGDAAPAVGRSVPVGRLGHPEEVADGFLFLMTNGYVNGVNLVIDGGVRLA